MQADLCPFKTGDSEAAALLHAQCFPHEPWPADAFIALLSARAEGFALWREGAMIGLILVRPAADEAEILTFAVAPAYRRRGLGARLLLQVMAAMQHESIAKIFLEVAEDNEAARLLYERLGFMVVAQRAGYYHGTDGPQTALVMAIALGENNQYLK
jgi:ribosomal-protein-alanine N-acetyltransferase